MTIIYIDERGKRGMEGERREMGRSKREEERDGTGKGESKSERMAVSMVLPCLPVLPVTLPASQSEDFH